MTSSLTSLGPPRPLHLVFPCRSIDLEIQAAEMLALVLAVDHTARRRNLCLHDPWIKAELDVVFRKLVDPHFHNRRRRDLGHVVGEISAPLVQTMEQKADPVGLHPKIDHLRDQNPSKGVALVDSSAIADRQ